jgi:hypothetical protein
MKILLGCTAVAFFLFPAIGRAQNTGRIECARNDGYVYLYSSLSTMDVRATLQCGDMVQITSHYESYYAVRTAKGETGYVPLAMVVVLKDQVGTGLPSPSGEPPARERMHYDEKSREAPAPARPTVPAFTLLNDTPVRIKILQTVSSANARVGDAVEFEVIEDVILEGVAVLPKGSKVTGVVAEADVKKHFGHGGKLAISVTSARLVDGEQLRLRGYEVAAGSSTGNAADGNLQLASGKDVGVPKDAEFTVLIDGDFHLKREAFANGKNVGAAEAAATPSPSNSEQQHR